jgi:hypothetical protein
MSQSDSTVSILSPPTRPLPLAQPYRDGWWIPVIYHPERTTEWLRFRRFLRKAKATAEEANTYAFRVLWHQQRRAADKRRKLEAIQHPRFQRYFSEAAE